MGAIHEDGFTIELYKRPIPDGTHLRDWPVSYSDDKTEHEYALCDMTGKRLVTWRARLLPGCCGILTVYYLRPNSDQTLAKAQLWYEKTVELIIAAAHVAKLGMIIMSLLGTSQPAIKALEKQGFCLTQTFVNGKTGHNVCFLTRDLQQPIPATREFACS